MKIFEKMFNPFKNIDWTIFVPAIVISAAGLVTMNSFTGDNFFFNRQIIWLAISIVVSILASLVDWRFLRQTKSVVILFVVSNLTLIFLFVAGTVVRGAQSWFSLGIISFQPSDFMKLILVLLLAKYFTRRHIEIAHIRHIIVSGVYTFIPFVLILLQPDFGSAVIIFLIWLGMVLVSGISKKHLLAVATVVFISFSVLWSSVFQDYQKERIISFIHPLADIQGTGYNAYQSTIAVGSGGIFGKGLGYGTQSRLQFLPEYETDFIFASFAEEWGFVGVLILAMLFGIMLWKILYLSMRGASNFETLFGLGVVIIFISHIFINVGMNIGLLPVTGISIPFMSYGGSHLLAEFLAIGILMGMRRYKSAIHKEAIKNEITLIS